MLSEIPAVFHNVSNYDDPFIIKNEQSSLRKKLNVFGKIQKITKNFSPPIKKEGT